MARGYITGSHAMPPGPQSSTGVEDVQMLENIDLIFGDNEELKFGDGPDAVMAWDATDLTLDVAVGSVVLTSTHGAVTGEEHSLDIVSTATLSSGDGLVGLNVAVTPAGTAGSWVSAIFGKVTEVAAAPGPVGGYFCGAEFEVNITGTQPSAWGVLVLNSNHDGSTYGQFEAYVFLREYGSKPVRHMVWFGDTTRASASDSIILSQVTDLGPLNTAVRCMVGTTDFWLYGSTVGPTTFEMAWTGAVRNKGLNFNNATFTAGSNYNLLSYGDFGNEVQLTVTDYCFPVRFNITSIANPGTTKLLAYLYLNFKQSTADQANLQLQVIGIDAQISKNTNYAIGVAAAMDVTTTCSTGGIIGGKFTVDISASQTLTHTDNVSALFAGITGTGSTSGGAHYVACIELNKAGASAVEAGMLIQPQVGATITHAIKLVGVGNITNVFDFVDADGTLGATTGAYNDAAQNSDGLIKIRVGGTAYYIPYYGAGKVTGEW